ncbi:helix-turn-helix domain-containing protein [Halorubrum halodurans]|jgi:predicted DNA binding protein|uniref:Bacterio-opsin activator n=1 Tax=Halorubrum halodurans TaxID=1383851 RepID=A0A256IN36_9EURY|nr:helix-turn-helix domain-containing protein [Halorubrum halodurans]OYR57572.1 bacterio-opsin activator [Halorubrum halodurans]
MPHAQLTVDLPEHTWIGDLSTAHPDVVFQVVTSIPGERTGIGLVRLTTADPLPLITDIQSRDDVEDLELLWKHDDEALIQIETSNPLPLLPVLRAGVPLKMPFDIQNGEATWEMTTSTSRLSSLGDHLDDLGIGFAIEYVREIDASQADQLLTDRQQEVLLAAVEAGYYRAPRESTLSDVAEVLDIANATCSDLLHRAEGHIIHWFVEEHMDV